MEVGGFQALGRLGYLSGLTPAGFFTAGRVHQAFTLLSLPWLFTYPSPSLFIWSHSSSRVSLCIFVCLLCDRVLSLSG